MMNICCCLRLKINKIGNILPTNKDWPVRNVYEGRRLKVWFVYTIFSLITCTLGILCINVGWVLDGIVQPINCCLYSVLFSKSDYSTGIQTICYWTIRDGQFMTETIRDRTICDRTIRNMYYLKYNNRNTTK